MALTRVRADQISDIDYKQAVRVIILTNITLTGGAPSQVDSVALATGDRVLVAGQSTPAQNGIYRVVTVGTGSTGNWVRTNDANATGEVQAGMIVMVTEGTIWADTSWKLITNNPIVIGTTALAFSQNTGDSFSLIIANGVSVQANAVSSAVSFTPGNNFAITGNNTADIITFSVADAPVFTGNVQANYFIGNGTALTGVANATALASTDANVSNLTVSLGNTNSNISNLANSLSNTNSNVSSIASNVTTLQGQVYTNANVFTYLANSNVVISTTGNITGSYILGNGALLTGLPATYSNTNVAAYLASNTDPTIVAINSNISNTTSNVTNLSTSLSNTNSNIANLSTGLSNTNSNVSNLTSSLNNTNSNVSNLSSTLSNTNSNVANITSNVTTLQGQVYANANVFSYLGGNSNVTIVTSGNITTTGNVSGSYILGNGSQLTGITANYGNANVEAYLPTYTGNILSGNISTTGNISVVGNTRTGNASVLGNITAGNLLATGTANVNSITFTNTGVRIGLGAGLINQGANSIAIGVNAGAVNQPGNTIVINATGVPLNPAGSGLFVNPVRGDSGNTGNAVFFNPNTYELTYAVASPYIIWDNGGSMGLVTEPVTTDQDLGLVTDIITEFYNLGVVVADGGSGLTVLNSFTIAALPSASTAGAVVYVTNAVGGAVPAFADGLNWYSMVDRTLIA